METVGGDAEEAATADPRARTRITASKTKTPINPNYPNVEENSTTAEAGGGDAAKTKKR